MPHCRTFVNNVVYGISYCFWPCNSLTVNKSVLIVSNIFLVVVGGMIL